MLQDYSLLPAIVYNLVEKVQAQQFVVSVTHVDNEISFTYKNGFKQRFPITTQHGKIDLSVLKSDEIGRASCRERV